MPKTTKTRRVILAAPAPHIISATVADMLAETGTSIIVPTESDVAEFGDYPVLSAQQLAESDPFTCYANALRDLRHDPEPHPTFDAYDPESGCVIVETESDHDPEPEPASEPVNPATLLSGEPATVNLPVNVEAAIAAAISGGSAQTFAPIPPVNVPHVQPVIAATIDNAEPNVSNDRAVARAVAARAIAAFYSGRSLPFKAASDLKRKAPINFGLNRDASARSAALLAAILTYCDVQPGSLAFVRGSGRVPGKLLGYTGADGERLYAAGPESGGLSNCIPDRIAYVSGALSGAGCEAATFRINYASAKANLLAFNEKQANGEHLFSAALGLLDLLHNAAPASAT